MEDRQPFHQAERRLLAPRHVLRFGTAKHDQTRRACNLRCLLPRNVRAWCEYAEDHRYRSFAARQLLFLPLQWLSAPTYRQTSPRLGYLSDAPRASGSGPEHAQGQRDRSCGHSEKPMREAEHRCEILSPSHQLSVSGTSIRLTAGGRPACRSPLSIAQQ